MTLLAQADDLRLVTHNARQAFVQRIAHGPAAAPWWTAVIVTASSERQAGRYREEIARRREAGKIPTDVPYLVVPDVAGRRIGSGGATLNALHALAAVSGRADAAWWAGQRVLIIHSGGDSRRLPEYSPIGKLFTLLPVKTPWGEVSTIFDETLALSTAWAAHSAPGLVVSSGDVLLTFRADQLRWDCPGVAGVAMRQPVEVGSQHGVYVLGEAGRVYAFLQKPSAAEVKAAGGLLGPDQVAVDSGLLHFDAALAARLTEISAELLANPEALPAIDLYEHMTLALTGQWSPAPADPAALHAIARILHRVPFACSLVEGDFTHVGTTSHFHRLITQETSFTRLYTARQHVGTVTPSGMESAGVVIDSVLAGGVLGPGAVAIECELTVPVRAGAGAILHGLADLPEPLELPEYTVAHQVPILEPGAGRGTVIRVYGVADNPKATGEAATWFGRPMRETLTELGIDPEDVWPGIPAAERSLWNAGLFVVATPVECWSCARWMMGLESGFSAAQWKPARRLSLAAGAQWTDTAMLAELRHRRVQGNWQLTALDLSRSGADIRPLLAHAPGVLPLARAARSLEEDAAALENVRPTEAASRHLHASLFFGQAGLEDEAGESRDGAFRSVRRAVGAGVFRNAFEAAGEAWIAKAVTVEAPARIDLGGGWSDTPPFCLDWGGTVLNMAVSVNGRYPIRTTVRRLSEPVLRCLSEADGERAEYRAAEDLRAPLAPGSALAIPRAALQLAGLAGDGLAARLERQGGLEIQTSVDLPMGSGLGTSSILAATMLRALGEMLGLSLADEDLVEQVLLLEQRMTTGGGWQDQAGGVFPGAKLIHSGPGLSQRLRVKPVTWNPARQAAFLERFVFYYTGIRRIAKDLLAQVVGRYLARETDAVQVLHSIKTLAMEMAHALEEGEWDYLGRLLDRHWELNQVLDPHTTNAPIAALLEELRPWLAGAKLAGAGGGGFLMLLAKRTADAAELRGRLAVHGPGELYRMEIASEGLRVSTH